MPSRWIAVAVGLFVAVPSGLARQTPQGQTVFRSSTILVPLDIRVVDSKGRPVTDLTAADFTIFENKVPQRIGHFGTQAYVPEAPDGAQPFTPRNLTATAVAPQTQRTFLILLGRGRLQYPAKGVDGVIHFVRERLLPQDRVAVFAWDRATDFTTNHEQLLQVLERFKTGHEKVEMAIRFQMSGLAAVYGSKEIPKSLQRDIDTIFKGPEGAAVREMVSGTLPNEQRMAVDTRQAQDALMQRAINGTREPGSFLTDAVDVSSLLGNSASFDEYADQALGSMQDLQNIYAGIAYLRRVEGEKHLIYLSELGLFLPRVEDDKSLAAIANDARVSLNVIHTGGTYTGFNSISTAQTVTQLTGGFFTGLTYADKAMDRIDAQTRFEYLLGYYPQNTTWDGKYRRIEVKVNRKGVTVLYRHGYYANTELTPLDKEAIVGYTRVAAAARYSQPINDLQLFATASQTQKADKTREVSVDVTIDASRIKFTMDGDRHVASLDISVFCGSATENVVGELWQKMALKLKNDTYERYMLSGIPYSARIPIKHVADFVKIVLYDYQADLLGSVVLRIK